MRWAAPNPSGGETMVRFALSEPAHIELGIYDVDGRLVRCLTQGLYPGAMHTLAWDGHDEEGRPTPSGAYLLQLELNGKRFARRLVRVR